MIAALWFLLGLAIGAVAGAAIVGAVMCESFTPLLEREERQGQP
jgi:hypothetical protein